jgi:hypothetical protein
MGRVKRGGDRSVSRRERESFLFVCSRQGPRNSYFMINWEMNNFEPQSNSFVNEEFHFDEA